MPIFEYNGKKYNVRDEHIDSFMQDFPDASTIMEREGKKYRVRSADYKTFISEQSQPIGQPAAPTTAETLEVPITPPADETPLSEQDKMRMSAGIEQMKRRTRQIMDDANERIDTMQEYRENASLGGGQTAEGRMMFNPESGKFEKTYLTPLGNRYTNKGLADMVSFRYRQAADMSVSGQLRRARLKLAELKDKRDRRASEVLDETTEFNNTKLTGFGRALIGGQMYVGMQQGDKTNNALDVAIRQTEELIKDLEEQQDREQGVDVGFWRGFGRIAGDFRTWDFGMSDLSDAMTMMNADRLIDENATEGERAAYNEMMGALYNKEQAEQMYGGNASFWNRAGVMTGHMPSFMLDFVITGGGFKGINLLTKVGTKAATKVVGKDVLEQIAEQGFKTYVKNNGVKGLGQYTTNWTIKALGTTADDLLVRAPLMTNTVQFGKTTSDIIDRKLGDVVVNEDGTYDFNNDKTLGSAIWQGEANAIIENYSEMFGAHLDQIVTLGNMSKLANVVGAKRIGAVLSKADAGALSDIMGQTHRLFNKMGVSDYFGEVTEEYYGQMWRTMLNLDDAYQPLFDENGNPVYKKDRDGNLVLDKDGKPVQERVNNLSLDAPGHFHGDIWGGMALSMGLMGAGKHALTGAQYVSMKHGVNKADAHATELLGKEVWEPLRATIDLTTNDDIGSVAEGIVNDKDFTDDERAAVLTYMERSLMMRGFNLGTLAQKRGGEQDEDAQAMDESYIDGYNIGTPQEMTDAKNMYEYQRQQMMQIVGTNEEALNGDVIDWLSEARNARNNGNKERANTIIDYLNAKQVYDGMIQRVRDDIDGRIDQSNAMVDARTNRTTGMIQGATMKQDDRRVYVVAGNLVPYADGSGIDNNASDGSIIVRDAETGALEQVSPDAVLNIDKPLNPTDERMTAAEAIRQQYAQEAADKIDGVVTFNPGDTYTITGDDAQIQVQVVANEEGIVDNGDGTVNVSDGTNIFPLAKETIQQQVEEANLARVAHFEQQRAVQNAERNQRMQDVDRPQYAKDNLLTIRGENGNIIRGNIVSNANEDEQYEVYTEVPINGKKVSLFSREELDSMVESMSDEDGNLIWQRQPEEKVGNNDAENIPENGNNTPQNIGSADLTIPAIQRIPKDEQGNPLYEQTDSDTAWDAIVEQTEGDEIMAQTVADGMVADKDAALKKLEKAKSKGGVSIAEKIAAEKERKSAIDAAKEELAIWQKIAGTANRRKMEAEAERRRIADEAAALRKVEEDKLRAEREEAERIEREALNGVPDMVDDTPQNARARGYRRVSGHKIDRQEPLQALQGKEVSVRFSDDAIVGGHATVIDATQLQPSHIQGMRNPLHFIDEAQPKERNDEASVMSARKIAGNIRPEEITSSVTAYTGAPTVNTRGEAIQGNNRSDALRLMWESYKDQAAQYKQYLKDHADEFGLRAEDIDAMERPVLVNMLDVDDAEAIHLGQFVAQDTESGGTERIKPKNVMQKMGNDMRSFANLLLASSDEETSFAGLVDNNGVGVLKWMRQKGYITPTQYKSAFDSKGNLTAEAKNDLRGIMYQSIFKGGGTRLEEMFNTLPAKAQKAILATAYRDYDSPSAERMIGEIQNSIRAYYALSQSAGFAGAKTLGDARLAVEAWKIQYQIDDVTGESYLPAENFSNFALHLATMYKGENQSIIQGTFNKLYDLIQGTQEANLFEQPDNTPLTLAQAIYETLNITYDGQQRSDVLVGNSSASQRGQQGSHGDAATGERIESGERTADRAESIEAESRSGGEAVHQSRPSTYDGQRRSTVLGEDNLPSRQGQQGSPRDAATGGRIESGERAADLEGGIETESLAGGASVHQPRPGRKGLGQNPDGGREADRPGVADDTTRKVLGNSNRGDLRVFEEGLDASYRSYSDDSERTRRAAESERLVNIAKRNGLFIPAEAAGDLASKVSKRTGESVVYINKEAGKVTKVKDPYAKSAMKSGVQPEDAAFEHLVHNLLFPETAYTLEGISEEMGDVRIVLSQNLIQNYNRPTKEQIAEALSARGLFPEDSYSFGNELVSVTDVEGDNVLLGEDGRVYFIDPVIRFKKPLREIIATLGGAEKQTPSIGAQVQAAEAEVDTKPTEKQKEAGNYKKGHVQIGAFNVTIEQPKGSVRNGVDKGGKKWKIEMQNTYGYIRGTEGVDGDHIDVFLSDNIDGWNGSKVFVIDQYNEDGSFDEHKVMLGFNDIDEANAAYLNNYEKGWADKHKIVIRPALIEDFERWIASSHRKTKPFAEYKSMQVKAKREANARLEELKTRIEELYKEQETAHNRSDIFEEARTIAEINELFAEQRKLEAEIQPQQQTVDKQKTDDPYTIAPAQYTTKKGKVLDMHLVKFAGTLSKEQQRAAKEIAKAEKGWYDFKQGGFMMRNEESARQLANTILGNEDAVSDAQPISLADTRKVVEPGQSINPSGNRLVTDERYAELRERMRKKLGQMNSGVDPETLAIGIEMAVYHLEKGAHKFTEYAKAMIADLGDAVRPYLKAFYNGARDLPEVEGSGLSVDMTSYDEVRIFDVANFDKESTDPFATAETVVAEQTIQEQADGVKQEIINHRNNERRKENEQTTTDTKAIASQAETTASKAESDIETATTEQQVNEEITRIDDQLEKVNQQLALLGYYEADIDESQFDESYGYMRSAEKKAVKDANALAKRLIKDLGIDPTTIVDKKGKKRKVLAQANIAPAGGNVYIRLPLTVERDLYISVDLEPDYESGYRDNLFIDHIILRIENSTGKGERYIGRNAWVKPDATYSDMLNEIRTEIIRYVPRFNLPETQSVSLVGQKQKKTKKSTKKSVSSQSSGSIFDGLFEDAEEEFPKATDVTQETFKAGDKVIYKGKPATIYEIDDDGRLTLDTGFAPVLYEAADPKDVERIKNDENGLQGIHELRAEGLPADSDRNAGAGSRKSDNKEVREESGRPDGRGESGNGRSGEEIPQGDRRPVGRLQRLADPKNTHNNHSERGKDHAPTSVDARIEANIKAIELAKQLLESGEKATEKQMQTLRKFSGWGGLGKAFSEGTYNAPGNIAKKLRKLLGEKAYQEAVMSANSAYYTPAYVVDTLWDIAEKMGFEGGNILESSAGIGNILGQMPTHISERSDIHAIEIDGASGGILSLLYPDANVEIQGFEETHIANGSVDLAITNVPFVTGLRVNDTTGDKDLSKKFHNIHDFCIAKNVRKLREGGLGIFITSNGTLDNSKKLRDWIVSEGDADFVGAFRMHNKTFGGTGVTSDIIVIRKRVNGQKSPNAIDVSTVSGERTAEYDTGETRKKNGKETPVIKQLSMDYNRYFIEHPENMAGKMHFAFEKGDTFRPTSKGLYPKQDKKQEQMLAEFVQSFKAEEFGDRKDVDVSNGFAEAMQGKKLGEIFIKEGKLYTYTLQGAKLLDVNANKVKGHTKVECFEAYTAIKEALAEVLAYQTENESDTGLKPLLANLNKAYDDFIATYGYFNKNTAVAFLRNDVDYANVASVETFKEIGDGKGGAKQIYGKADVMKGRVVEKEKEPTPTNVKDGIIASIFKFGRVDVPYIADQLGTGIENVKKEIIESSYGFENPITRQIEASYQYLSGNVREKLRQAEENNKNGKYDRNIKALQGIMPMEIPAHLIDFTLGSSWIDPKLYEEYVKDRTDIDVKFTAVGGTWFMKSPNEWRANNEKNRSMGVVSEMLGRTIMGHTLIEAAIQNKSITVSSTKKNWDGSTETIIDKEATQACAAKIDEIRQNFKDWARQKMQSNPEMSALIERIYNDTFNNFVPMSIPNEFVPEYFGGASHKFKMRPHQGRAIVRGTQQALLLAHEVGTGKTFTLISIAMEMRRLGTARKPMIVVQNATVGQFVEDAKKLYPNAKILTLEEADRSAEGRKNFYAKIRYNDWDMIVVPQSTFEFIPDSDDREMAFVQDKIDEKMLILEKMKEEDPDGNSMITRQAEREIELLEEQLAGISDKTSKKRTANDEKKRAVALQNAEVKAMEMLDRRTDDVENFDDMGIDALLVDEAHEYKHLGFATAMQRGVKGVDPSYSKKSQGVFLKTQAVLEKNNGRNVIFATGTPISNTAAEIWTFMRYLMPADTMKEYGIYYFDDFVRNFGNIQQMLEFTTSGKFKENNRFAGYVNLPELVRIWSGISDTVLTKEAEGVSNKIPEMENGKAQDIYLPQTRALRGIMKFVKAQLEEYDKMSGKEKKENSHIPLTMYGIAKAAAVDARLVQEDAEDDEHSKTNEAVRQTLRTLQETADYKGTVAIFADNYRNKHSGFNIYDDIRHKLIEAGVPADEIVIMKSGMTVKKKLEIFEKVNRGEVRVILGSTFTLGTGVNIQERLHTLIHLDAPNRPMDYTQRNGRILRQGNLHKIMGKPVRILRFGVEDSLDVTAYQRLKTKGAIADSIMNGKQMMSNSMANRVLEEEEDVFGDTVAQLSGSEYAMLKNNAEKNMRKYASRKKQYEADQTYIHNAKPRVKAFIKDAEKRIEDNTRYLEVVRASFPDGKFKEIIIGKHRFTSIEAMEDFFKEHNKSVLAEMKQMKEGEIAGDQKRELTIQIGDFSFVVTTKLTRQTMRDGATLFNDVERKMTYSCAELGIEDIPVRQNLLRNAIEDITRNVITGKNFAERLEAAERNKKHNEAELEQLLSREGKPFEYEQELAQAQIQFEEYAKLMKKELEEKEAKYAEMDATVEAANDITNADEEDTLYRSDDATKNRIEALFNQAISGEFRGKPISIGTLTDEGKAYLEQISGITFKDKVDFVLNPSDLIHIYKRHFGKNEKDGRNIPLDMEDIRSIVDIISNPDRVIYSVEVGQQERKMFSFLKEAEQGTYNLLEIYSDRKGNLTAKSFYKSKEGVSQRVISLTRTLHSTSETDGATLNDVAKIPQMFETASVEEENTERAGDNVITPTRAERRQIAKYVEKLAKKLHLDNVEIVTDTSTLEGKKLYAKGFYTKSTGKITIVMPNHPSMADVEQTLLHEAVAHYGLRELFGEHFDTFLDNVFNHADKDVRRRIVDLAAKNSWDFRKATEEYLAVLAERTEFENARKNGWWQKIKNFFLNMLHKIGFEDFRGVTLSDNELRYILWRSYENLAEPGRHRSILGEATDVAMQYELKVGNYAVANHHTQTAAESDDVLYRDGNPEMHERELVRDRYERRMRSGLYQSQEALQDSMLSLQEAMLMIDKKAKFIEDIAGFENAYLGENRLSSVNKAEADAFAHTLFKPMLNEVARLARNEAERKELTDYMMAKHGLERNAYMRNEAIKNGATDADQTDYAGLTALTGMDNVADAEAEAQRMVDDYEQAHETDALWEKVNAVSKAILSKSYECGMMSKATFDKISGMYDFYIPLRGFDEKTSSEVYAYLTHKQSAFNAPIKKAEGRRSKADDPFANLQSMAEGVIMQGNRNKLVKQRFLNFALNHPSDLVSVSDIWVEYDAVTDEWKPVFPDNIDSTDTPEKVEKKMQDFETKMESLAQQYPDQYKHGKDTVNIPYRIVESRDIRQHQIVVKRGGRDYVITINGNPRAAQALNGQTNPDNDMSGAIGAILRAGENINRQLSAFYTTRNPDFIVSNFMRDMLYTNTMTWIRESPNYALRFHRNYMYANPVRIKQLLAKHRKGTLDMSDKTEAMFHQFMMNGGETGYANIRDIEQHKNDIRRELKKSNGKISVKKAWDLLGERFDEYNRAVENCARFAAFMTSREMGRSIDRAIYDAKEISVNFNKKGSGAKFYDSTGQTKAGNTSALVSGLGRSGYVFWNAAIQGTTNFGRQMKHHPAKAFTGIAAMFLLGAVVAYLGGDDDDDKNAYYNLPEYVRRCNILFRAGDSWISIPLPVEYRAVYGMGELMISVLNGKEHLTGGEIAEAIAGQATQILPIDFLEGGGGLNAFVPSAYKPLWEAYVAEKSWTGMPLYKDTPWNKDMPEWTKAYKSANKYIVGLANVMNEATGGDPYTKGAIDFNPAKIEYMLNGYFGGVFGTIDKLSKTAETIAGDREYDPRSILLVNRLVKAGDERTEYRAVNNEYFRLKEEHDRLKTRLRHYEEDTDNGIFDYAEKIDFLYNSPEYERYEIFEDYHEDIDDLYNELKEAVSDEERKDIEAELNELKKEMIEEMNLTRKRK
jgi:N12 class adenine-specific DNA methylase